MDINKYKISPDVAQSKMVQPPQQKGENSIVGFGHSIADAISSQFYKGTIEKVQQQHLSNGDAFLTLAQKATDPERRKKLLTMANQEFQMSGKVMEQIAPSINKSNKKILGEALGTLGWMSLGATPTGAWGTSQLGARAFEAGIMPTVGALGQIGGVASNVASRLALGTAVGAGVGLQQKLKQNAPIGELVKGTTIGAGVGLGTGLILEGVSKGFQKLTEKVSEWKSGIKGETYIRELQPSQKELSAEIESNFETTAKKIADATDENGKPLYQGSLNGMNKTADEQIVSGSKNLRELLKSPEYKDVIIRKSDFENAFLNGMERNYGNLTEDQLRTVIKELDKLPNEMNLTQTLNQKQIIDNGIPKGFWTDPSSQVGFLGQTKYYLRDILKEEIEYNTLNSTNGNVVKQLNNNIGLAMDVRHLTAEEIARKLKDRGWGGLYSMFAKLIERTVGNPAVTTRVVQTNIPTISTGEGIIPMRQEMINEITKLLTPQKR